MRLLDLVVSKTFIGQPLSGGAWYWRLELPDGLDAWKKKQKFTVLEANEMLAAAEADFIQLIEKFRAALPEGANLEDSPTLWLDSFGNLKMTVRCLIETAPGARVEDEVEALKKKLKEADIYLRVKML